MKPAENRNIDINAKNTHNILDNRRNNIFNNYSYKYKINQFSKIEPKKEHLSNQPNPISLISRFFNCPQKKIEKSNNKKKINENINNSEIFKNLPEKRYNQNSHLHDILNKKKTEIDKCKDNHKYYEIKMITKKPNAIYYNPLLDKVDIKNNENNYHQYKKIENNKVNNYFKKILRIYDDNKGRSKDENINLNNGQNKRINKNQNNNNILFGKVNVSNKNILNNKYILRKNKIENSNKDMRDLKLNMKYPYDNYTQAKNVNYTKQNDLNKINKKNIYIPQNIKSKKKQTNVKIEKKKEIKFINKFQILETTKFDFHFDKKKKKQKDDLKINKYELTYKRYKKNKNTDLKMNKIELFFDKKDRKNILLKSNKLYFNYLSKNKNKVQIKCFDILDKKKIEAFEIKGKEKKSKKTMSLNDKKKEILLYLRQYDLTEEGIKGIIEELNSQIIQIQNQVINIKESQNTKNNKSNENAKKKQNDNNNKSYNNEIVKEKESIKKLYGFKNQNNNCYLNSSLQLLTRIKDLKDEVFIFNEYYEDNDTQGRLIIEFRNLLKKIENSNDNCLTLDPSKLKRIMGNVDEKYYSNSQEDSNEFISNFINALLAETGNKKKKYQKLNIVEESEKAPYDKLYKKFFLRKGDSFILNLFYGIFKIKYFCKNCGNMNSIKFNVYNMIELPLVNLITKYRNKDLELNELLKNFTESKKSEDKCSICNSDNLYSKSIIYTLPKYLIISFIRICDSQYFSNNIIYPKYLKIKSDFEKKESSYLLDCVVEHSGGLQFGHYTSLIPIDKNNNKWVRYSDNYCNGHDTGFESRNALILLYKLI